MNRSRHTRPTSCKTSRSTRWHTWASALFAAAAIVLLGACNEQPNATTTVGRSNALEIQERVLDGIWQVTPQPDSRLRHGWLSFERVGKEIVVREHLGGGNSQAPISEPLALNLAHHREGNFLHITVTRQWRDRRADVRGKTSVPNAAVLRIHDMPAFVALNDEYQILWLVDVMYREGVVKSVAYVARLAPMSDTGPGFDKHEVAKVLEALKMRSG